ncbi:MAG: ADP,ATP carrier protein 1 [Chlamydiae bacterium]|nr:ADP,ATP carrier protein 1 [Chlamydiota bacterium]
MLTKIKSAALAICPIRRDELKKFIPMFVVFFFVGFVYNILRNTKDAVLITGQSSGAEIIPFVKVWVMLPGALLMTAFFSRLSNKYTMERVFYILIAIFVVYFLAFTFIMYPNSSALQMNQFGDFLGGHLPKGALGFVSMIRHWSFTLFYVMCELWSCIILSILFWGFANETTTVNEATRFYGFFGIGMNFSGIAAGHACIYLSRLPSKLGATQDAWFHTLAYITLVIAVSGIIIIGVIRWMHTNVFHDCKHYKPKSKNKFKLSLRKNFSYLAKSKYLICIAIVVVAFNLVINLVEVLWKDQVRQLYPNPSDFSVYLNQVTVATGIVATVGAIFTSIFIRKFGWTKAAFITPAMLLVTSIGFFGCLLFKGSMYTLTQGYLGMSPLALVAFFGSLQICLSRGCKYTVFDATKEISFLPLTPESRKKGKAAIDGVGSRLGKSGGSVIHQGLLMVCSSFAASAPYIAIFLLIVICLWMFAVKVLGFEFKKLTDSHANLEINEEELKEEKHTASTQTT